MLQNGFVEGLRWLGRQRFVFELGVDFRSGGDWQLEEAEAMLRRVNSGLVHERERVLVVISEISPCTPSCGCFFLLCFLAIYRNTNTLFFPAHFCLLVPLCCSDGV